MIFFKLKVFTKLRVTIDDPSPYQGFDDETAESGAQDYSIVLRPIDTCTTALKMLKPDCLICWGVPADVLLCESQKRAPMAPALYAHKTELLV